MHASLPDGTMRDATSCPGAAPFRRKQSSGASLLAATIINFGSVFAPEYVPMLSLSQYGVRTGKLALACSDVADAIGVAGAIKRIKRTGEIGAVAIFNRGKRAWRGLMAARGLEALGFPAM